MKHSPIDLFYQTEDYFFRSISKECLDYDNLTTAYFSEDYCESDNPVYIKKHIEAIDEAIKLGANHCVLEASEAGIAVYEKLGFEALFKNRAYSVEPSQ